MKYSITRVVNQEFAKDNEAFKSYVLDTMNKDLVIKSLLPLLDEPNKEFRISIDPLRESKYVDLNDVEYRRAIDVNPITMCKDCKHCHTIITEFDRLVIDSCELGYGIPHSKFFCADGEPKDKED